MKCKAKSMMAMNQMTKAGIKYEGDGYVTGYPIISNGDAYILNGVVEANSEYIVIDQWVPVYPGTIEPAPTKYRVILPTGESTCWQYNYLCKNGEIWHSDDIKDVELLTADEIEDADERYMAFAEPVWT